MLSKLQRTIIALQNNNIMSVDLAGEKIGCDGIKAIAGALILNTSLKRLVLGGVVFGCGIDEKGISVLANALVQNRTLMELDLRSNKINDVGAKALANKLQEHCSLVRIDLRSNPIGDEGAKALVDLVQNRQNKLQIALDELIHDQMRDWR